jgi:hypothetical protein
VWSRTPIGTTRAAGWSERPDSRTMRHSHSHSHSRTRPANRLTVTINTPATRPPHSRRMSATLICEVPAGQGRALRGVRGRATGSAHCFLIAADCGAGRRGVKVETSAPCGRTTLTPGRAGSGPWRGEEAGLCDQVMATPSGSWWMGALSGSRRAGRPALSRCTEPSWLAPAT